MKLALMSVLALIFCIGSSAHATDASVTCGNADFSIAVTVHFKAEAASDIEWKLSRSAPADHYTVLSSTPGSQLWPDMPTNAFTKFPFGSYVGTLNGDNVVLNITRDASFGGGGYQWEGVFNFLGADGRSISWGMFCNQDL
jgi:hypothetical protein